MNRCSINTPLSGSLPIVLYPSPRGCRSDEEDDMVDENIFIVAKKIEIIKKNIDLEKTQDSCCRIF